MITLAESGLPEAVYNAINEGGKSLELRVTRYPAELFPEPTTVTLDSEVGHSKIQEIEPGKYVIAYQHGSLYVMTATTTTLYHANIFDFYWDGTHIYGFRNSGGTIYREKYTASSATSIETLNVGTFTWQTRLGIRVADQNTIFYFRSTNNNANYYRRTYNGSSWSETASEIWLFDADTEQNRFYVQKMDNGKFLTVMRFLLPGEIYNDVTGSSTTYVVERNPHIFSYIWGETELQVIYQEILKDDIENYAKILFSLNKYGDYYVAGIATIQKEGISVYDSPQSNKSVAISISKDGKLWSELIPLNPANYPNYLGFSILIATRPTYPGGPVGHYMIYTTENIPSMGIGFDGEPIYHFYKIDGDENAVIRHVPKSPRLYGFDNCDPGEDITSWIDKDQWEFEIGAVSQFNMVGSQNFGNALFRHELGYHDGAELHWHQYAVTQTDTVTEEYDVATGKTTYRVSTRDLTSWMMDRFQSYESREWHGHYVSVENFNGKQTKLSTVYGSIEYLTGPNRGKIIPPVSISRAIHLHTGQPDKRNHCLTAYFEPQTAGATAHIVAGWWNQYNNKFGLWLNITTTSLQARAFHNGVDVGTAAGMSLIATAGVKYIRSQLHYGLWTIYYSTNNTTWSKVSYPIPYTGMVMNEERDRPATSAPFALSYPGIGNFGSTPNDATNFYYVINSNRNRPIQLNDILKIGGAFSTLPDVRVDTGTPKGSGTYIKATRTGTHTSNLGAYANTDESSSKLQLNNSEMAHVTRENIASQFELFISTLYSNLYSNLYTSTVATVWMGNEIVSIGSLAIATLSDPTVEFASANLTYTQPLENAFVDILTIDVGEAPIQGIKRALEGREHLDFFLRRTGELWLRPVTKNPNYPNDTNLIANWTSRKYEQDYTRIPVLRRKISANVDTEIVNPNGFEGQFDVEQNTMIENPIEPVYIPVIGTQKRITYNCEIPLFQELYDAIIDGYRIQSISGRLVNGKLDGQISIGNEELL